MQMSRKAALLESEQRMVADRERVLQQRETARRARSEAGYAVRQGGGSHKRASDQVRVLVHLFRGEHVCRSVCMGVIRCGCVLLCV